MIPLTCARVGQGLVGCCSARCCSACLLGTVPVALPQYRATAGPLLQQLLSRLLLTRLSICCATNHPRVINLLADWLSDSVHCQAKCLLLSM